MLEWYDTTQLQDDFTHRALLLPGLRGSRERCRWLLRTRTDRRPMPERWDYKCIVSERVGHHDTRLQTNRASPFWHFCVDDLLAFQFAQLEMSFPKTKGHTLDKWPPPWWMWTYSCAALKKASWSWKKQNHVVFLQPMPVFHFANGMEQHPVSQDQSLPPAAPVRQHFQKDGGTSHGEAIRKHENMVLYSLLVIHPGRKNPILWVEVPKTHYKS